MPDPISIDDLGAPMFSSEGQAINDQLATLAPSEFTIDAMVRAAEEQLDVPLFRDEYMLDNLDRFVQEGDQRGPYTDAGRALHFESSVGLIIQRSRDEARTQFQFYLDKFPKIGIEESHA